jgi:hypothetical protein
MTAPVDLRPTVEQLISLVPGPSVPVDQLTVTGSDRLASAFNADTVALASAAASNLSMGVTEIDRDRVITSMTGHVELDGAPIPKWADLSGYYETAGEPGRFIQFHCNFPHHAQGIVDALECEPNRESLQQAVLTWDPLELESMLIDRGLIAAQLRTLTEWADHPHARATANLPLVTVEQIGSGSPRKPDRTPRVLDCSRVLAGPIAGQTLAAGDADVLRVGAAHLPSVDVAVLGTGFGKRNAFVDLDQQTGRADFGDLLSGADVWIDAYRPNAFADRGFGTEVVTPGSVTVQISAFDWIGPWGGRRGFDSIVQSTTGIVDAGMEAADQKKPTPLPVQLLDYATGYLAAFAARRLLQHQAEVGGTWLARLSLLRTRNWLVSLGGPNRFEPRAATPSPAHLCSDDSEFGRLTAPLPIGGIHRSVPEPLGSSAPRWSETDQTI